MDGWGRKADDEARAARDRELRDETVAQLRAERANQSALADKETVLLMEAYRQFHDGAITACELQRHALHFAFLVNELAIIDEQITELVSRG